MIFVHFCTWKHTHKTKIKLSTSITRNTERFIVVELKYFDFWQKFFHVILLWCTELAFVVKYGCLKGPCWCIPSWKARDKRTLSKLGTNVSWGDSSLIISPDGTLEALNGSERPPLDPNYARIASQLRSRVPWQKRGDRKVPTAKPHQHKHKNRIKACQIGIKSANNNKH